MEFQLLVIIVALVILVVSLILIFFNTQNKNTKFPGAMTNCPDYWDINTTNGNCIIPSEDIPNANIGNLKGKGKFYYIYNDNNKISLSTDSSNRSIHTSNPSATPGIITGIPYTPYDDENYKVYSYRDLKIPGYIDVSLNVPKGKKFTKNVNIQKLDMSGNEINFNDSIAWSKYEVGNPSICNIKTWANSQNIVWDGIHNYNKCP